MLGKIILMGFICDFQIMKEMSNNMKLYINMKVINIMICKIIFKFN